MTSDTPFLPFSFEVKLAEKIIRTLDFTKGARLKGESWDLSPSHVLMINQKGGDTETISRAHVNIGHIQTTLPRRPFLESSAHC